MIGGFAELLRQILVQHGEGLVNEPFRLQILLSDHAPTQISERQLIAVAVEAGIPQSLLADPGMYLSHMGREKLVRQIMLHQFMRADFASWAVNSWAYALSRTRVQVVSPGDEEVFLPRLSLTAQPPKIAVGQAVTFTWTTQEAEQTELLPYPGIVAFRGRHEVAPRRTAVYTLRVRAGGLVIQKSVGVEVYRPPPSFDHRISAWVIVCLLTLGILSLLGHRVFRTEVGTKYQIFLSARPDNLQEPGIVIIEWHGPSDAVAEIDPSIRLSPRAR